MTNIPRDEPDDKEVTNTMQLNEKIYRDYFLRRLNEKDRQMVRDHIASSFEPNIDERELAESVELNEKILRDRFFERLNEKEKDEIDHEMFGNDILLVAAGVVRDFIIEEYVQGSLSIDEKQFIEQLMHENRVFREKVESLIFINNHV